MGDAEGICKTNPATAQSLALPRVENAPTHHKALPYTNVAECIATVKGSGAGAATKLIIEFIILTAVRSGEARLASWDECDFHGANGPADASRAT